MPAPPSPEEWRREALAHCLRIAAVDPEYAIWAADEAERLTSVLAGLGDKVRAAIEKRTRALWEQQHEAAHPKG